MVDSFLTMLKVCAFGPANQQEMSGHNQPSRRATGATPWVAPPDAPALRALPIGSETALQSGRENSRSIPSYPTKRRDNAGPTSEWRGGSAPARLHVKAAQAAANDSAR